MFGLFKKSLKKEYWERIRQSEKSFNFIQNNNPFTAVPAEYEKHTNILIENKQWFSENLEELKKILNQEVYEMTERMINN